MYVDYSGCCCINNLLRWSWVQVPYCCYSYAQQAMLMLPAFSAERSDVLLLKDEQKQRQTLSSDNTEPHMNVWQSKPAVLKPAMTSIEITTSSTGTACATVTSPALDLLLHCR